MSDMWRSDSNIAVLQDKYSVSFTFTLVEPLSLAILGDPLAVLWWEMGKINPHWYLQGDDNGV